MIPGIELVNIVVLAEKTRAKLERVAPLKIVFWIVGSMRWDFLWRISGCR
jgi:hypothetical protein